MIPITPDILGPGIAEEYEDALVRLDRILEILKDVKPGNDTFKARVVANCLWLRQMVLERTMPIPLDRRYWSTLGYVTGDMTFAEENWELTEAIGEVVEIIRGRGLLKERHYPVAVALVRDLIDVMQRDIPAMSDIERGAVAELGDIVRWLENHKSRLPLDKKNFPNLAKLTPNEKFAGGSDLLVAKLVMQDVIFGGMRPTECMKGELKAPVPGLPTAPPKVR